MFDLQGLRDRDDERAQPKAPTILPQPQILALQRTVGNAAVTRMLQRRDTKAPEIKEEKKEQKTDSPKVDMATAIGKHYPGWAKQVAEQFPLLVGASDTFIKAYQSIADFLADEGQCYKVGLVPFNARIGAKVGPILAQLGGTLKLLEEQYALARSDVPGRLKLVREQLEKQLEQMGENAPGRANLLKQIARTKLEEQELGARNVMTGQVAAFGFREWLDTNKGALEALRAAADALRDVLYQELVVNGVKGFRFLADFVQPTDFINQLIGESALWIDPGAGAMHGEFTHSLQWFCIAEHVAQHQGRLFGLETMQIYSSIKAAGLDEAVENNTKGLWDVIVDSASDVSEISGLSSWATAYRSNSFRSPEYLTNFILKCDLSPLRETFSVLHMYRRAFGVSRLYDELTGIVTGTGSSQPPKSPVGTGEDLKDTSGQDVIGTTLLPGLSKTVKGNGINTIGVDEKSNPVLSTIVTIPDPKKPPSDKT